MAPQTPRSSARFRVHLSVRYEIAHEFVREYAENLSRDGLFITGAQDLELLQEVAVEIGLPGFQSFRVRAEVAHIFDEEHAAPLGRVAGAGLAITRAPPGFQDALTGYLHRLGKRADATVLTTSARIT